MASGHCPCTTWLRWTALTGSGLGMGVYCLMVNYVKMLRREDSQRAITELNGLTLSANSEPLFVTEFIPAAKRYTKLDIANISPTLSSETLGNLFSAFCRVILVDWQPGNPFGFIHFRYSADGQAALKQLNNAILGGRALQARKVHSKRKIECTVAERAEEATTQILPSVNIAIAEVSGL